MHPGELADGLGGDAIFPHFIATQMPAGLAGLIVAALAAAAMSSIDTQVKAVVQLREPGRASEILAEELIAYCRKRLSPIKCPKSVDFMEQLPREATGKLYKRLLKEKYWG